MDSRIKDILKEKGMTISQLAEGIVTPQASLSRALGENGNPTYETLSKIANVLGVDMSDLFRKNGVTANCPHCGKPIEITIK